MAAEDSKKLPFPSLKNDLVLRAAYGKHVERVPVWLMRQAGRYLPEFKQIREHHDFFEICRTPQLACEVTMQPIRRFDLDAAIIFSDILVLPQAMGMEVIMKQGVGPRFTQRLNSPQDMKNLDLSDNVVEKLHYVYDAITLTRHTLNGKVPLIGFAGGPWTLMGYMIEGGGSSTMSAAKNWLYKWPEESSILLQMLTNKIIDFLVRQVESGAQALQLFESNVGFLGPQLFNYFVLPRITQIAREVKLYLKEKNLKVPMIIFAKGAHYALQDLGSSGFDVVTIDWTISPEKARKKVGVHASLQGNLDPCALFGEPQSIKLLVKDMIQNFGTDKYIANLGHGVYPDAKPENIGLFVDSVHSISQELISESLAKQ